MRNFTDIKDISSIDIETILERTKKEKRNIKENGETSIEKILAGKSVALISTYFSCNKDSAFTSTEASVFAATGVVACAFANPIAPNAITAVYMIFFMIFNFRFI